ncbi:MAG: hypothetical protein EBT89_11310 [Opitutaceae bacterium]|nr:hypothetical protein [Opitutaceae bacterium]
MGFSWDVLGHAVLPVAAEIAHPRLVLSITGFSFLAPLSHDCSIHCKARRGQAQAAKNNTQG